MEYSRTGPTREEEFSLKECLEEVIETLEGREDRGQVKIRLSVSGAANPRVVCQRELIYRVFLNLGINALEASSEAGNVHFRLRTAASGGWEVLVIDDGNGMEKETLDRIFNPFFTTKTREGGLGLALVEKIVHSYGGTIEAESEPGRGSRFQVRIPSSVPEHDVPREECQPSGVV